MVVFYLKKFPQRTRGLLSRYTIELSSGLFVGKVGKRMREELWGRIVEDAPPDGFACISWSVPTAQGLEILSWGKSDYSVVEYDGLVMLSKNNLKHV